MASSSVRRTKSTGNAGPANKAAKAARYEKHLAKSHSNTAAGKKASANIKRTSKLAAMSGEVNAKSKKGGSTETFAAFKPGGSKSKPKASPQKKALTKDPFGPLRPRRKRTV